MSYDRYIQQTWADDGDEMYLIEIATNNTVKGFVRVTIKKYNKNDFTETGKVVRYWGGKTYTAYTRQPPAGNEIYWMLDKHFEGIPEGAWTRPAYKFRILPRFTKVVRLPDTFNSSDPVVVLSMHGDKQVSTTKDGSKNIWDVAMPMFLNLKTGKVLHTFATDALRLEFLPMYCKVSKFVSNAEYVLNNKKQITAVAFTYDLIKRIGGADTPTRKLIYSKVNAKPIKPSPLITQLVNIPYIKYGTWITKPISDNDGNVYVFKIGVNPANYTYFQLYIYKDDFSISKFSIGSNARKNAPTPLTYNPNDTGDMYNQLKSTAIRLHYHAKTHTLIVVSLRNNSNVTIMELPLNNTGLINKFFIKTIDINLIENPSPTDVYINLNPDTLTTDFLVFAAIKYPEQKVIDVFILDKNTGKITTVPSARDWVVKYYTHINKFRSGLNKELELIWTIEPLFYEQTIKKQTLNTLHRFPNNKLLLGRTVIITGKSMDFQNESFVKILKSLAVQVGAEIEEPIPARVALKPIEGLVVQTASLQDILSALTVYTNCLLVETSSLKWKVIDREADVVPITINADLIVADRKDGSTFEKVTRPEAELPKEIHVRFINKDFKYEVGEQFARKSITTSHKITDFDFPLVLTSAEGQSICRLILERNWDLQQTASVHVISNIYGIEIGDVVNVESQGVIFRGLVMNVTKGADNSIKLGLQSHPETRPLEVGEERSPRALLPVTMEKFAKKERDYLEYKLNKK